MIHKYDIFWVDLSPTIGSKQEGKRPCAILQNNIANYSQLQTVCIAPFTSNVRPTPTGILIKDSHINNLQNNSRLEISQLRVIDKSRLMKKIGEIEDIYYKEINQKIQLFFDTNNDYL